MCVSVCLCVYTPSGGGDYQPLIQYVSDNGGIALEQEYPYLSNSDFCRCTGLHYCTLHCTQPHTLCSASADASVLLACSRMRAKGMFLTSPLLTQCCLRPCVHTVQMFVCACVCCVCVCVHVCPQSVQCHTCGSVQGMGGGRAAQ